MCQNFGWMANRPRHSKFNQAQKLQPSKMRGAHSRGLELGSYWTGGRRVAVSLLIAPHSFVHSTIVQELPTKTSREDCLCNMKLPKHRSFGNIKSKSRAKNTLARL